MLYKLLKRIFKEHAGAHIWIPALVTAFLSGVLDLVPFLARGGTIQWALWTDLPGLMWRWLSDHGREIVGIYLAFVWIVWRSVRKASDVQWTSIGQLSDNLVDADRYFAIGTIPLREWFEPNALVYLATIIRHQLPPAGDDKKRVHAWRPFHHERVLLFYDDSEFRALQASYLDEHYAKSFSAVHDRFDVPLAYLGPEELRKVLLKLSPEARLLLGAWRWFAWPGKVWNSRLLRALAKNPDRLRPFAAIETPDGTTMMAFVKDRNSLAVERITDTAEIHACKAFAGLIEDAIYRDKNTRELWEHCTFSRYLNP